MHATGAAAFGLLVLLAMASSGCASHANRSAGAPRVADEEDGEARRSRRRTPHTCKGAEVKIVLPPENNLTPADLVRTPELGPEPPPPEPVHASSELMVAVKYAEWRTQAAAESVARAIEDGVPGLSCHAGRDSADFTWRIFCGGPDDKTCKLTTEVAHRRAEQIRAIVTPAVQVGVSTCACRVY